MHLSYSEYSGSQQQSHRVPDLGDPVPAEDQGALRQAGGHDHLLREDVHQGVRQHELERQ